MLIGPAGNEDIQVYDWQRDRLTHLTFNAQGNLYPVWTPDGKHIAFTTRSAAGISIQWIRADGAGETQTLLESRAK
jgi:Tol biopolymer transport system component